MSKSLKRVKRTAAEQGLDITVVETTIDTHTAEQAAQAQGCHLDQIGKSIILRGCDSGAALMFLTAGGNRVDMDKATAVAGQSLGKADAALIRAQTGFAIGGVSPIGHLNPITCYMDPRLLEFTEIWVAAGTPRHLFSIDPAVLRDVVGARTADFTT